MRKRSCRHELFGRDLLIVNLDKTTFIIFCVGCVFPGCAIPPNSSVLTNSEWGGHVRKYKTSSGDERKRHYENQDGRRSTVETEVSRCQAKEVPLIYLRQ